MAEGGKAEESCVGLGQLEFESAKHCDEVAEHLAMRYPEFQDAVLVIHTNAQGDVSESARTKATKEELEKLRRESREIDSWDNPYKAVVSVMVLREGWDVQNVTTIVGLRPYSSEAKILPEQTLGRGLRRMFRGQGIDEKVSVVGTEKFMEFVEGIKSEGVDLEYRPMGDRTPSAGPMVIEVDRENKTKDLETLDIELPRLMARIERDYKNLDALDPAAFDIKRLTPSSPHALLSSPRRRGSSNPCHSES